MSAAASVRRSLAGLRRAPGRVRDRALQPVTSGQERLALAIGRMEARTVVADPHCDLRQAEFRVFSQSGEDGIIQFLVSRVPIDRRVFVEFGVEDYRESNTRFLLQNDGWEGLIIDGGTAHVEFLDRSELRWRHTIEARSVFLTRENVNAAIAGGGVEGDIGLLSVDVDGNDYWLLDALTVVSPRILIVEYNSLFGSEAAVTVPYRDDFSRLSAHWSGLHYGASLAALHHLATSRQYQLVGCNRAGTNAFFVRRDVAGRLPAATPREAYVDRQHRESRDRDGQLTHVSGRRAQLELMADQEVVDVVSGRTGLLADMVTS